MLSFEVAQKFYYGKTRISLWSFILHLVNIGTQALAFSAFFHSNNGADKGYPAFSHSNHAADNGYPIPISHLFDLFLTALLFVIAVVNVETLNTFSVLTDWINKRVIFWYFHNCQFS